MAHTTISSTLWPSNPRAAHVGTNRMHGTLVWTLSQSASEEGWLFAIPANCLVTGGALKGSQPASGVSGQTILKLGTQELDNAFGTYTVSGAASISTRLSIYSPVTVSTSDDVVPYQRAVIATITSGPSVTVSLSLYVLLEYVMPGVIN
jgi:hypothetical protein